MALRQAALCRRRDRFLDLVEKRSGARSLKIPAGLTLSQIDQSTRGS
jgi:hypothetical protein